MSEIKDNVTAVRAQIEAACQRVGRDPQSVTIVAVTKNRSPEQIVAAWRAGLTHFGENRVEEADTKIPAVHELLAPEATMPTWHMIGHVQSRKARAVAENFAIIHSLDSIKLARRYSNFSDTSHTVFLQVNVSGEESKYGIAANRWQTDIQQRDHLWEIVRTVDGFERLKLIGLMTMAPYYATAEETRPVFARLRQLQQALAVDFPQMTALSMGMTTDYPVAVEEGATLVRVGRAIFGE